MKPKEIFIKIDIEIECFEIEPSNCKNSKFSEILKQIVVATVATDIEIEM